MISFLSTTVMAGWFLWNPVGAPESTNTESNWTGLERGTLARGTEEVKGAKLLWAGRGARGARGAMGAKFLIGATLVWVTGNTGGSSWALEPAKEPGNCWAGNWEN